MVYAFGDCELDPRRLELRRSGETVGVQPKPLELLSYLVRNRQRAVAKQELVPDDDASALRAALVRALPRSRRWCRRCAQGDPDLLRGPVGEQERFLLCDGMASLLAHASRQRPLLVLLDDLHWADPPSLFLLRHLAPALRSARAMLLATVRPSEHEPGEPLAETLADLNRQEHCRVLRLEGLSEEEVTRFLATRGRSGASAHFAAQLHRRWRPAYGGGPGES